jgi:hypothetical protein
MGRIIVFGGLANTLIKLILVDFILFNDLKGAALPVLEIPAITYITITWYL